MIFASPIRVPPLWPHSAGCGGTDQGPEGAGHVAQSLRAVSPGSRHDAETLDLLSRNHSETHLWETKGNKLGHSRRSNDGVDAPRRHRGAKVVVLTATLREASVTEVS